MHVKRKEGKQLRDFSTAEWSAILQDSGLGTLRGGVRGLSIFTLTNFTATSAAVASLLVTASLSIAEQAHRLRKNDISELEFIEKAELMSVEAAVSALSSFVGQALIPIPVLGAVIGNTIGAVMHHAVSSSVSEREAKLIEEYRQRQRELDDRLSMEYDELIESLEAGMANYFDLLEQAFSPDLTVALLGSIELAHSVGVRSGEILDTEEKTLAYFLD